VNALHALSRTAGWVVGHRLSRDVRTETALAQRLQRPTRTGHRIAVLGSEPAVGATTVAALLAVVLAHYRSEDVLAVDGRTRVTGLTPEPEDERCDLAERIGVPPPEAFAAVNPRLTQVRGGLWVLPGGADVSTVRAGFAFTVLDAGTAVGRSDGPAGGTVAGSPGRVLVVPSAPAGLARAWDTLGLLAHGRPTLAPADILFVERTRLRREQARLDGFDEVAKTATGLGVRVARLGYDCRLAEGGALQPGEIAESTRWTLSRLAADPLAGRTSAVPYALN
jgi:hypothetical protein